MASHIVTAFENELREINRKVAEMGGLAEKSVVDSIDALIKRDTILAQRVIGADTRLDQLQREIEEDAITLIAKRQPLAVDLREVVSAIRISNDLERVGDLAKNTAKRVLALKGEYQATALLRGVEHMSEIVLEQLKEVLDAFGARDASRAMAVWKRDGAVDDLYTSLFRELLTYMIEDPRMISSCAHLLFIAKNLERIGDHGTNIAEYIHFLITGEEIATQRPRADAEAE
jgi:phosphate transport system protein